MAHTDRGTYMVPRHGWTCFHCGEHFSGTDAGEVAARQHFGLTPDWLPRCLEERTARTGELLDELRAQRLAYLSLRAERNDLEERLDGVEQRERELARRFANPRVRTDNDVWNEYHSAEGRALSAEAMLAWINNRVDERDVIVLSRASDGVNNVNVRTIPVMFPIDKGFQLMGPNLESVLLKLMEDCP